MFILLTVLGCFWFVFLCLSSKYVVRHKVWQAFLEGISRRRFQLMVLNDAFSLFYLPLAYFAFMQLPNLFSSGGFYGLNAFLTLLLLLAAIIMPMVWVLLWWSRSREEVHTRLWFLTIRIKPIAGEREMLLVHDK